MPYATPIPTGQDIGTLAGHQGPVTAVVFFPDGSAALCGGEDGKLILWDVNEDERLQTFVGHIGNNLLASIGEMGIIGA